jgi:hypothetical protein
MIEKVGKGFIEGVGVDSLLWAASSYIPQLAEESPVAVPGWMPGGTGKTHWDDLIAIASSAGIAVYGVVKKKYDVTVEGVAMLIGSWFISQFQPYPSAPPFSTPKSVPHAVRIIPPAKPVTTVSSFVQVD